MSEAPHSVGVNDPLSKPIGSALASLTYFGTDTNNLIVDVPIDYRENLRFYYGFQWPPQRINQRRRRLVFNYAKTLVEKVTSYLMVGRTPML